MTRNHETWEEQLDHHRVNSDIAAMLRADKKVEEAVRELELRDVRIEALTAAARVMCFQCSAGVPALVETDLSPFSCGPYFTVRHRVRFSRETSYCNADPIYQLIVGEWA